MRAWLNRIFGKQAKTAYPRAGLDDALSSFCERLILAIAVAPAVERMIETADENAEFGFDEAKVLEALKSGRDIFFRPIVATMFVTEFVLAALDHSNCRDLDAESFIRRILADRFGFSNAAHAPSIVEVHRDTIEAMFADGSEGPLTVNEPQLEFVWGVLLGNMAAREFCVELGTEHNEKVPSLALTNEVRRIAIVDPRVAVPPLPQISGSLSFMKRRKDRVMLDIDEALRAHDDDQLLYDRTVRLFGVVRDAAGCPRSEDGRVPMGLYVAAIAFAIYASRNLDRNEEPETIISVAGSILNSVMDLRMNKDIVAPLIEGIRQSGSANQRHEGAPADQSDNLVASDPMIAGRILGIALARIVTGKLALAMPRSEAEEVIRNGPLVDYWRTAIQSEKA